jgi:hypothetical protein
MQLQTAPTHKRLWISVTAIDKSCYRS